MVLGRQSGFLLAFGHFSEPFAVKKLLGAVVVVVLIGDPDKKCIIHHHHPKVGISTFKRLQLDHLFFRSRFKIPSLEATK